MSASSTRHILVVDSDPADRHAITTMLRSLPGAVPVEAGTLEHAYELLETQEIHCIVVDHNIPVSTSEDLSECGPAWSVRPSR